jgi:hypothetical protein
MAAEERERDLKGVGSRRDGTREIGDGAATHGGSQKPRLVSRRFLRGCVFPFSHLFITAKTMLFRSSHKQETPWKMKGRRKSERVGQRERERERERESE